MSVGVEHGVHQLVIAINCTIIRYGICTWTVDTIKQTLVNRVAAFSLRLVHSKTHEVVTKSLNPLTREDTKDIPLWMRKFGGSIAAKPCQVFTQECLNSSQREVCQSGAIVKKRCYTLLAC